MIERRPGPEALEIISRISARMRNSQRTCLLLKMAKGA